MLKSDRRRKFFDSHPRRSYCTGSRAAVEIDHAPARTAFPDRPGVGDIRSMLRVALEKLEAKHKVTTITKAVAKKAGVTAKRLPAGKARGHKAVKPAPVKAPATVEAKAA